MKELKVHYTSDLLPFSYNSQENLERSDAGLLPIGKIFTNHHADLALMARGTALEVIYTCNGSRRSACNLGTAKENIKIQCMSEFVTGDTRKLLLGLDVVGWKRNGLICVYDLTISKVIRAIFVPEPVAVIQPLDIDLESESFLTKLSDPEKSQPLVIVGCKGGQTLIVRIGEIKSYDQRNDLSFPAELNFIKVDNLIKMEEEDLNSRVNYAIDLSTDFYSDSSFRYLDAAGKPIRVFKRDDVSVTSLLHLKQAALFVVGYSFGCFQIWDSQSLQMIFSSSLESPMADITHLVLQEPENDPRHCCYLLVGRSPSPNKKINLATTISLYQLVFEFKDAVPGAPSIYRELEAVCKRFEHQLTSDAYHLADSRSLGSRIIACSALARQSRTPRHDQTSDSSLETEGKHIDTTLSYILWESPPQEQELHPSFHLGLFDINRWYHLQMPSSIRDAMYGSKDPVCPFFAFYSLGEIGEVILPDTLVDAYIDAKDVNSFSCPSYPSLEQNFWPSSLSFKCTCLAERGLVKMEMLGMQRQILADMVAKRSEAFNDTYQLFNMCWSAGLMPKVLDISRLGDQKVQFECLFSVAIEHNAMSFVMGCIRDWSTGEITNSGSCLKSVLQWAWKRVIKAKGLLDRYYISLFYSETNSLNAEVSRELSQCVDEMAKLVQVLNALKESPVSISEEGAAGLSVKLTVARCISQYAETILFFIRSGILPECSDTNGPKSKLKNHICDYLADSYSEKRDAISDAPSIIDGDVLFIDDFCKDIRDKIADNDNDDEFGWDGKYPPPSVNAVCKTLLLEIPKHRVISFLFYWILDVAEHLEMNKLADNAACYYNIPRQQRNVIEALWEIDRKHFEIGIKKLIEHGPELLPDAMKVIYYYGNKSLACSVWKAKEMLSSGDQDGKLCIRILLENRFLHEAYKLQARYRETSIGFELYQYFLEECIKNNLMSRLFDLHLTGDDEDLLFQFLEKHKNPAAMDLLVVLCIKRHRYAEAIRYGGKLALERKIHDTQTLLGNSTSRKAIMDMTKQIIPPIQRKLIAFPAEYTSRERRQFREVARPEPLSAAIVRRGGINITSHSETIFKVIHSVEVNRSCNDIDEEEDVSFDLPFVRSAVKSMSAGRKRRDLYRSGNVKEKPSPEDSVKAMLKPSTLESVASSIPLKRRKHLHYGAEAMQLLKTPPVIKNPLHFKHMRSQRTPASILKSRVTLDKTETAGKSIRKRVVIADPNAPSSPVCSPESPSFLESSSFDLKSHSALPKLDFAESPRVDGQDKKSDVGKVHWQVDDATSKSFYVKDNLDFSTVNNQEAGDDAIETGVVVKKSVAFASDDTTTLASSIHREDTWTIVKHEFHEKNELESENDVIEPESGNDVIEQESEDGVIKLESKDDVIEISDSQSSDEVVLNTVASEDSVNVETADVVESVNDVIETEAVDVVVDVDDSATFPHAEDDVIKLEDPDESELDLVAGLVKNAPTQDTPDAPSLASEISAAEKAFEQNDSDLEIEAPAEQSLIEGGEIHQSEAAAEVDVIDSADPETRTQEEVLKESLETTPGINDVAQEEPSNVSLKMQTDDVAQDEPSNFVLELQTDDVAQDEPNNFVLELQTDDITKDSTQGSEEEAPVETKEAVSGLEKEAVEVATCSNNEPLPHVKQELCESEAGVGTDGRNEVDNQELEIEMEADAEEQETNIDIVKDLDADVKSLEAEPEKETEVEKVDYTDESQNEAEANSFPALGPFSSTSTSHRSDTPEVKEQPKVTTGSSGKFVTPNIFTLPSMRNSEVDSGSAVEELIKRGRGNLKIIIDKSNVTSGMIDYDTSFESPDNSFAFTPSDNLETPDNSRSVFETIEEREATPPKQAKIVAKPRQIATRSKSTAKQDDTRQKSPKSPVKTKRISLSPSKLKRRSFHTPRISESEATTGYTPPITRSARKNTPIRKPESKLLLQGIGENMQLESPQISESAISFVPAFDAKKSNRRRSSRRSLQSPLVAKVQSPHTMTLRNRTKIVTPDRFL